MENPEYTLWDFVNMITTTKEIPEFDENFDKVYSPFVVNRFFSFTGENSIIIVNEINKTPGLGKREHFIFLHAAIRKSKRRSSWVKQAKDERLALLSDVYECSIEKAKTFSDLLSPDQMLVIEDIVYKGGVKGAAKGSSKGLPKGSPKVKTKPKRGKE